MHAFDELWSILSNFPADTSLPDHHVAYAAALVSELAYYHVPEWEIDDEWKRAKRVPCFAHQRIYQLGRESRLTSIRPNGDGPQVQVFLTNRVVSVVVQAGRFTFIGFRGTVVAHDWFINLQARKDLHHWHAGFYREASRICAHISARAAPVTSETILCGHSLGGAVAAAALNHLPLHKIVATYIFGAPRVGDHEAIKSFGSTLFHLRRQGDVVPSVPPRYFGYVDYPTEFNPYLAQTSEFLEPSLAEELHGWYSFASDAARPHFMETYRSEVGLYANAQYKDEALVSYEKITGKNIHARPVAGGA
jgi:Lipase (class 3)